jgi:hypothetical protein
MEAFTFAKQYLAVFCQRGFSAAAKKVIDAK